MMLVIEGLGLLAALSDGLGGEDIETGLVVVASKTKTKAKKATSVRMKTLLKTSKKSNPSPPSCQSKLSNTYRQERNIA